MENTLFAFFVSLIVVAVICAFFAIKKQIENEKETKTSTVIGSDNHKMPTEKYSGKYSMCKKIGEANEEF